MSWLSDILAGKTEPRAIEVEQTQTRIRIERDSGDEQRARELLVKAEEKVWSNGHERATAIAVIGCGYAVLAVVEELRSLKRHSD
jgi:hypothetical protein